MIGRTFSHYRLLEELGKGGMGVVYLAEDTLLRRRVAIKFPSDSASRRRVLSEARAASALNHPAIAAIYDCGEVDDSAYIVMELVEGESLNDKLRAGPLPVERAVEIVAQVAEALGEAHGRHIVHRDIKPSNIRIDRRGAVKVVDFGLAKRLAAVAAEPAGSIAETQTMEGTISGTPQYMSPEQARGESGDGRSDIFSLGAVFYECLTGRRPFRGATRMDVLAQVLGADPPPPSQANPAVPARWDPVVRKALAKTPAERYQSAAEMLADLRQAPAAERPARRIPPRLPLARSARARWAAVGAVLAVAALAGLWTARHGRVYQPSPEVLRWCRKGVAAIRDGAYFAASKSLEKAALLDPQYPPAHARLAEAYSELDDDNRANREMLKVDGSVPLSRADERAIDAVRRMIKSDFTGAVKVYRAILSDAPAAEKAAAYVDLGRALEKAENPKEAMESYDRAARLLPDYPAAYLRAGMLAARGRDIARSEAAFKTAESLYGDSSNAEGVTEVLYQRGLQAFESGRYDDAAALLERARLKAEAIPNDYQTIAALLLISETEMRKAAFPAAEQRVTSALDLARRQGLEVQVARGTVTLGNLYFRRGDLPSAGKYFTEALAAANRLGARRTQARAHFSMGSLYSQRADYDRAAGELEQALRFYEHGGYQKEKSQVLALLGRARRDRGDYEGALAAFGQVLEPARKTGDADQTAQVLHAMGLCEFYRERYPQALALFEERTAAARSAGARQGVVYGLSQWSRPLHRLGRYPEAKAALREGRSITNAPGRLAALAGEIDLAEAEMALSQGRYSEVRNITRRLLSSETLAPSDRALTLWMAGSGATRAGAPREGELACAQALSQARVLRQPHLILPAMVCHAEALAALGRSREALEEARAAQSECARIGKQETEATAWLAAAKAAAAAGDGAAARNYASQSLSTFDALAQTLGADRKTFDARPDVQQWRRQAHSVVDGLKASAVERPAASGHARPSREE